MRKIHISIFWKFSIGILMIVSIFGSINILLIHQSVIKAVQSESEKRGKYIAFNTANQAIDPILFEDYIALQKIVDNIHILDSSVVYAFIELEKENDRIIIDLQEEFPIDLLTVNELQTNVECQIKLLKSRSNPQKIIRDIAVPILNKDLATVRIGILEDRINENANQTLKVFLYMIGIFLILGIFGAFAFSQLITRPIKTISKITENLDFSSLSSGIDIIHELDYNNHQNKLFFIYDELDYFSDKFFLMIDRLRDAYIEIDLTYSKLIQSEKMASIGTLSAGIAHEINNPNTGIQYCIRILKKDILHEDKNREYLDLMEEASEKIERVVKGLLDYSRPPILDFENIDLNEVIDKSISMLQYKLEKQNIILENKYAFEVHLIYGAFNYLEQVLINLIMNAVDAIEEKNNSVLGFEGKISIEIVNNNNHTTLIVSDNGIGINESNLIEIFDPFYTSKEVGKGTGLGLAVTNRIIALHNGSIKVVSNYGIGTIFTINLPTKKENLN